MQISAPTGWNPCFCCALCTPCQFSILRAIKTRKQVGWPLRKKKAYYRNKKGLGNLALSLFSVLVYYCLSKGREFPSLHFDPEVKSENMKKQTLNTALNILFYGRNCSVIPPNITKHSSQNKLQRTVWQFLLAEVHFCQLAVSELPGMVRQGLPLWRQTANIININLSWCSSNKKSTSIKNHQCFMQFIDKME